ncbi:DUF2746 domain-containing protein [Propionimicrobium lymphophilum]|uniref:DUF2746 domain-containing protein n=1 Tax=Propionimicrobium lymphophilum TaxID=33012 RepID=UPI00254F2B59|nr:DUF2746 domain-containing protein [Propionimicrobium lymphophilum]MDK7709264.1 DUF2746 domain-containing protein [Propionimicrobium lymphophilum]MDK7733252.1 DUF2746 domain-containing protein [Propionimicrobium lymphophilum]
MPSIPPDQIDDVLTAASLVITALATLAGVLLGGQMRSSTTLKKVSDQVTNSHGTNLRDDLDQISEQTKEIKQLLTEDRQALADVRRNSHDAHKEIFERINALEKGKD